MKKICRKITLFIILVVSFITVLLNYYGGYIDPFYEKFTTPKQFSMILGDSRAMQGIQPKVLDSNLKESNYKLPIYNFSFTIKQATYGASYLNAIKRKLDTTFNNQLFVVTVNPWMLANRTPKLLVESDSIIMNEPPHNITNMTMKPNIEYFIKNFRFFNFRGVFSKNNKLHKDGWSEIHIDDWLEENNFPKNKEIFLERKHNQMSLFGNFAKRWNTSKYRLNWLEKTIVYLQQYGKVFVVRMPIDKEILEIENEFWSDFDIEIDNISKNTQIDYFNFSNNTWSTYDGQHLDKFGGKSFAERLSELIKNN
ncbi:MULTISPECIES: hypothetical protein [Flavobacteriaceae]|uniref:Uncharacterized protein n=2 Tax=Flavobacteriaceae TaxID=49546 RepID=A0A4Y8ATQ5_9FLAO|nr:MULTISPECIES: hypothetical protein [Flavobacteriaceae]TEW75239.1 hypothetical protein E2488_06900 [Gramella jeungdoensis]GGK60444.1 hypothetical protein GCM10007963_30690 [Lutibacter litoralis]